MSTLKVNTLTDTAATKSVPIEDVVNGVARAWVNFNGTTNTGGNCDIRASYNVTDVDDNGTGNYTINFTNAMPDANYIICSSGVRASGAVGSSLLTYTDGQTKTTTSVRVVNNATGTTVLVDNVESYLAIFR
jgi:hypothetical protein